MTEAYRPVSGAIPVPPYITVRLSERDLGFEVPINFLNSGPGVSLTRACFSHNEYENAIFALCLSNLLAVGIRRFLIDLYWDQGRRVWSLCPVESVSNASNAAAPTAAATLTTATPATISSASLAIRDIDTSSVFSSANTSSPANATRAESTLFSATTDSPNAPLEEHGPYTCSLTINAETFFSILWSYFGQTQTNLDAHLLYTVINLRAAAAKSSPTHPAPSPTLLPSPSELIGQLASANLSTYLYKPVDLQAERADLNNSWYTVAERYRPVSGFYSTSTSTNGVVSTEDGWPSESFIEFSQGKRLIMSWGSIDPQMSRYNFSGDAGTIFDSGYTQNYERNVKVAPDGNVTQGCFYEENHFDVASTNSSWATTSDLPGLMYPANSTADISALNNLTEGVTRCGIAPILNTTISNSTAGEDYTPYRAFSYSTIWSWAPGEPQNSTENVADSLFRCATTSVNTGGRWAVSDCSQRTYAACRVFNQPYNWTVTTYQMSYSYAPKACPDGYVFAAPRTALENTYLTRALLREDRDHHDQGVWVDFNSLDIKGCWTTGGQNATCPYREKDFLNRETVIVPTVAGIIILIVTTLVVLVKASTNRKVHKRTRKRANNGFVYEGVPS